MVFIEPKILLETGLVSVVEDLTEPKKFLVEGLDAEVLVAAVLEVFAKGLEMDALEVSEN